MKHTRTFSSTAAIAFVAASLAMSTNALGACKSVLRGELIQADNRYPASPGKFLSFSLVAIIQPSIRRGEDHLQSFVLPTTTTTFPIPFELHIDSPKDCPNEVELSVSAFDDPDGSRFVFGDRSLSGYKIIRLESFATVPVRGPFF